MYEYQATLVRVIDGDTVELDIDLGMNVHVREKVRLDGINTPEIFGVKKESEEYIAGLKAKVRVQLLLQNNVLVIQTTKDKKGKYGRYIAKIFVEGKDVGETLVQEGLAVHATY